MNGRGGKRQGAGRKSILDDWERIAVGSQCENVQRRIAHTRRNLQLMDDLEVEAIPEQWEWVNAIPVPNRSAWGGTEEAKQHRDWMDEARLSLSITSVSGRYGVRKRVITEVTAWAEQQFGVQLKASFIKDCWEQYRAFAADVAADD